MSEPPPVPPSQRPRPRTYLVGGEGQCRPMPSPPAPLLEQFPVHRPYRLCRFLCDLEDLDHTPDNDGDRLAMGAVLLRRFLTDCPWVRKTCPNPDPTQGMAMNSLHREPGYPITIKTVAWGEGVRSPVHSHGTWALVAILGTSTMGWESNQFWQRLDDGNTPGYAHVKPRDRQILKPGDVVGMKPDTIHSIAQTSPGPYRPTWTLNIYGKANLQERYRFEPAQHQVRHC